MVTESTLHPCTFWTTDLLALLHYPTAHLKDCIRAPLNMPEGARLQKPTHITVVFDDY